MTKNTAGLPPGVYDALLTRALAARIQGTGLEASYEQIEEADQAEIYSQELGRLARPAFERERGESERVRLFNGLVVLLGAADDQIDGSHRLVALREQPRPGAEERYGEPPATRLGLPALITNARDDPSVGHEIKSEIESADRIDLLCAFIKWHGLRTLEKQLAAAQRRGIPLRVITSTYMGATERRALDRLVDDFGAEVKVDYEIERTRLHAKAWLFTRNSRFDTAYVGSSNLSVSALLDGVEWNVRLTRLATPALINKFGATFETYWNDPRFEDYLPERDGARLERALAEAGRGGAVGRATLTLSGLEVRPYPHQTQILEDLDVERQVWNRHRNLVVAATGTGKTVIAALDYKRLCEQAGRRLKLLFVAHRREILDQAQRTFREVLADSEFGEQYVAGQRPEIWQQVFASIQSLNAGDVAAFSPDAFDVVIVDEFHHAAAASYTQLLDHFLPGELLGLTATPERADGLDVRVFFEGRIASEMRLWDALGAELLCPFHYFGIHDQTDLTAMSWRRGAYDADELSRLYTGNDARSRIVLQQLRDKVADVSQMRALGFCVGVEHARYMAEVFRRAGIPAAAVSGATPPKERGQALKDLRDGRIKAVFTADLFNEGIDLPDVDTLLFLRPTESPTIFLQQLGRGLRRTRNKAVLTVLDFVGNQRAEFRYDTRFSAMTGIPRGRLARHVENQFPFLPSGCEIILDREATELILANLKSRLRNRWSDLVSQLRVIGDVTLLEFLQESGLELANVIKGVNSWTRARSEAGLPIPESQGHDENLLRRGHAFAHVDDPERLSAYRSLLSPDGRRYRDLPSEQRRFARMLLFSVWPKLPFDSYDDALSALRADTRLAFEIGEILGVAEQGLSHVPLPLPGRLADTNLRSHARYTREEILAALDDASPEKLPANFREGVLWAKDWNTDAFLVTLNKSESGFSPTTMYDDYAISPTLFHWESQSGTKVESPTGQRYVTQRINGNSILLFTRDRKVWEFGKGGPYTLLGTAEYVSHQGEQPISITWRLNRAMPDALFRQAAADAG